MPFDTALYSFIVSILAHPERWALLRFFPYKAFCNDVSILAHPERWALLQVDTFKRSRVSSFNPRPPRKVGATNMIPPFDCD